MSIPTISMGLRRRWNTSIAWALTDKTRETNHQHRCDDAPANAKCDGEDVWEEHSGNLHGNRTVPTPYSIGSVRQSSSTTYHQQEINHAEKRSINYHVGYISLPAICSCPSYRQFFNMCWCWRSVDHWSPIRLYEFSIQTTKTKPLILGDVAPIGDRTRISLSIMWKVSLGCMGCSKWQLSMYTMSGHIQRYCIPTINAKA